MNHATNTTHPNTMKANISSLRLEFMGFLHWRLVEGDGAQLLPRCFEEAALALQRRTKRGLVVHSGNSK
jgi:hypothetical protein